MSSSPPEPAGPAEPLHTDAGLHLLRFTRDGEDVPMIFRTGIGEDGVYRSEDMHFFKACRGLGYKVHVDPNIELGHVGGKEWKGKLQDTLVRQETPQSEAAA